MKTKVSPTIVGAFVIGAVVLGIVALFAFGGFNFFAKPQRFVVYFDESVHGLDQGSQVKLRGVRVGRVVDLTIRYDGQSNRSVVAVVCEFSKDVISDNRGQPINVTDRAELQAMVQRGLRARLEVQGWATGLLFVGLDFLDPMENPPSVAVPDDRFVIVPFVPSAIAEYQASITEILAGLRKIDFDGISKGLTTLMADVRRHLDGVDLRGVTEQWKRAGAQVETLVSGPDMKRAFETLNTAIAELRGTIAKIDRQVDPMAKDVHVTLADAQQAVKSFHDAAAAARDFLRAQSGLGDDLAVTFERVGEAAESVKRLADFLERNPSAIITGRKVPQ
ncbi:MAG: MlaD family protein [Opitutaceae bacterium]|nr:MlaD family protein [Opitutaceae bacterium]